LSSHEDKMPLLVKRRVQVTGGSTYIISIPKEWAKLLNIDKGSEVVLELSKEGWIRITSAATGRRGQSAIDIELNDGLSEAALLMQIIAAYLAGYDVIRVRFSPLLSEVAERVVSQVRSKVLGLELLEESGEQMTLRNVVDLTSIGGYYEPRCPYGPKAIHVVPQQGFTKQANHRLGATAQRA